MIDWFGLLVLVSEGKKKKKIIKREERQTGHGAA